MSRMGNSVETEKRLVAPSMGDVIKGGWEEQEGYYLMVFLFGLIKVF